MTTGLARLAVELLLQGAAALPDTIITKQVAVEQGAFAKVASVAQGLMTISILVLTVALVPAAAALACGPPTSVACADRPSWMTSTRSANRAAPSFGAHSVPSSRNTTGSTPKNGRLALPGFNTCAPGKAVMRMPPVSVCHQVCTMGQRPLPMTR